MKNAQMKNTQMGKRQCLACGKIHNGEMCPLVRSRFYKYSNSKNRNVSLMGGVLLECIHKNVDFMQILLEIAEMHQEINEMINKNFPNSVCMPVESSIEYLAMALNCKNSDFFKNSQKAIEEYGDLIEVSYEESIYAEYDNDDVVEKVVLPVEISSYTDVRTKTNFGIFMNYSYPFNIDNHYAYTLCKERVGEKDWVYKLYVNLPDSVYQHYLGKDGKDILQYSGSYWWESLCGSSKQDILLAQDYDGALKRFFEREFSGYWMSPDFIETSSFEDIEFQNWMRRLEEATRKGFLEWKIREADEKKEYYCTYRTADIVIMVQDNESGKSLYVRDRDEGFGTKFECKENNNQREFRGSSRLTALCRMIDEYIDDKREGRYLGKFKKQYIDHTEIIAVVRSMTHHEHVIKPLRGIVRLLTQENKQVDYEIYVGYCPECNKYYCFYSDYINMIQKGKPLCAIYEESDKTQDNVSGFRYKSQSVLNAMGYTVGMETNLSSSERQKILEDALQSHIFSIHDLISFLTWLIQTRKNQRKFSKAVEKWTEDLKFVKNYEKEKRGKITVEKIVIKTK